MQRRTFWQWLADKANVRVHLERAAILGWIEHGRIAERAEWERRLRPFVPPPETPVRTNTVSTLNPPESPVTEPSPLARVIGTEHLPALRKTGDLARLAAIKRREREGRPYRQGGQA